MRRKHKGILRIPESWNVQDDQSTAKFLAKHPSLFDGDWNSLLSLATSKNRDDLERLGNLFWDLGTFASAATLTYWVSYENKKRLVQFTGEVLSRECTGPAPDFKLQSAIGLAWFHVPPHWAKDDAFSELMTVGGKTSLLGTYSRILVGHFKVPVDEYFFNLITVTQLQCAQNCALRGSFGEASTAGVFVGGVALASKSLDENSEIYTSMTLAFCDAARSAADDTAFYLKAGSMARKIADCGLEGKTWEELTLSMRALSGLINLSDCVREAKRGSGVCTSCGKAGAHFMCMVCDASRYCNLKCQQQAWNVHRRFCQRQTTLVGRTAAKTSTDLFSHFLHSKKAEILTKVAHFLEMKNFQLELSRKKVGEGLKEEDVVMMVDLDELFTGYYRPEDELRLELRENLLNDIGVPPWFGSGPSQSPSCADLARKRRQMWVSKLRDKKTRGEIVCFYLSPGSAFYANDFLSCHFGVGLFRPNNAVAKEQTS